MWFVKTRVILALIGATVTISKSFRKYVSTIPGTHEVREPAKTAILGTAHIFRKVLTYKYTTANAGTNDMDAKHGRDRIAATLYSLETWFVSGIYV
jgi:hypothetical protein